jgi:hypothetical protein
LAALLNSVVKHGTYVDRVIVGYRGPLPNWLPALNDTAKGKICTLNSGLTVEFIELKSDLHMVHEKPQWLKLVNEVFAPGADEYFFFDSDIIVLNRMPFFGEWVKQGVGLCEDINYDMSANHPVRKQWATYANENGLQVNKNLDRYYNSGFLAWSTSNSKFIDEWFKCFNILAEKVGDVKTYRLFKDRTYTVLSANQDALNLAAMITNQPLSTIGPGAMGFHYGTRIMAHPVLEKPWDKNFLIDFFLGKPPRTGDLHFWQNVNGSQLKPVSAFKANYKIALCKMLKFFGRFYAKH